MSAHTPEPWRECGADSGGCSCGQIWSTTVDRHVATAVRKSEDADDFTDAEIKQNARRIAACINACVGLDTDSLEMMVMTGDTLKARFESRRQAESQRDKLISMVKKMPGWIAGEWAYDLEKLVEEIDKEVVR